MGILFINNKKTREEIISGIKKKSLHIILILLVIIVTVFIFIYRDKVADLGNYGYLGLFLISLISSATIILPMPSMLTIFVLGAVLNPVLVGIVAAMGGTIGESTGYLLGNSGRSFLPVNKLYIRVEKWMKRWGTMVILVFALIPPLSIDVVGIVAGSLRFPLWKFFLACLIGKVILYTGMAFAGFWGVETVFRYFGW